eukprot:gene6356-3989_t
MAEAGCVTDADAALVAPGRGEALPVLARWEGAVARDAGAAPPVLRHVERVLLCLNDDELRGAARSLLQALLRTSAGTELMLGGGLTEAMRRGVGHGDDDVRWVSAKLLEGAAARACDADPPRVAALFSSGLVSCA